MIVPSKTAVMKPGAAALLLLSLAACSSSDSGGGSRVPAPQVAPTVISNLPLSGAIDVAVTGKASATFSQAMDPATLSATSFTLTHGMPAVPVSGAVSYANSTALFTPTAPLANSTAYTATLTTGAKSAMGMALAAKCTWSFTTVAGTASVPTILSTTPANGAVGVPVNGTATATFSEAMDPATLTTTSFTVTSGMPAVAVAGAVSYANARAVFTPTAPLPSNTTYTATIKTGAKSAAGVALAANRVWSFTTVVGTPSVPTILSTMPLNGALNVPINGNASATFSEAMDPATLTATSFTVTSGMPGVSVPGSVSYANSKAVFTPTAAFANNTPFTATVTTGAQSAFGIALAGSRVWSFTTGTTMAAALPVNLGAAGTYVILAQSGISTVPASAITGNLGLSPAAASFITGFSLIADATNVFSTSSQVTGKIYAADYAVPTPSNLTTAVSDMQTAFTDAAGRAPNVTELGAGDIGGKTLIAGVYKWGTGLLIPTDVTLTGSATDVFIFQIAQNLTLSSGVKIILAGGALPKNIFWQVSGGVNVGTTAHLEGVVLTQTAVAMATGSTINGRLMAQTAVTLDGSTVVAPAP